MDLETVSNVHDALSVLVAVVMCGVPVSSHYQTNKKRTGVGEGAGAGVGADFSASSLAFTALISST